MAVRNEELIRAVLDGKTIQYKHRISGKETGLWCDWGHRAEDQIVILLTSQSAADYRIKPNKKVLWLNVYANGFHGTFGSWNVAVNAETVTIARVRVEYEEGQFDTPKDGE